MQLFNGIAKEYSLKTRVLVNNAEYKNIWFYHFFFLLWEIKYFKIHVFSFILFYFYGILVKEIYYYFLKITIKILKFGKMSLKKVHIKVKYWLFKKIDRDYLLIFSLSWIKFISVFNERHITFLVEKRSV